jgi:hypothetical protein
MSTETTGSKKKMAIGLVVGAGVLLAGGVALAATGKKKKKEPTGPTVVAPDVPGVDRGPDEPPVLSPRDQTFANITEAFYTVSDPQLLRSMAAQARIQAQSGGYSKADATKLLEMADQLENRAAMLEGGAPVTPEQAAQDAIAKLNAAFYQETDPAALRSLADQATLQANAGAYPPGWKSQVLNAADQLRKRANQLAAQQPVQVAVPSGAAPVVTDTRSPGFVPAATPAPAEPVVSIDLPDGPTVDIPKPVADEMAKAPAGSSASIPLPGGQTLELPPEVTQAIGQAAAQLPAVVTAAAPAAPVVTSAPLPTQQQVEQPDTVAEDTAAAADVLLTAEGSANWKRKEAILQPWQAARGLKPDQQFGPKSALAMAEEIGTVPIIRFWPQGAIKSKAVPDYQAALYALAAKAPEPRRSQLRASAQREQGQGFERNPKPVAPLFKLELA